ncbi:MAG: 2-oxoacid:acceptor oxidoreductase family protein [Nitrospiraceae bacterium]|nr:2-oxoacid:acceptor oxidoreductase family protein [Nitrospiraceae bacterium]
MMHKIIIAGSGGQGILFLGKTLAFAGMSEGKEVTWFPSYGAEMRGGTANCTVVIADEMIGSPVVLNPDILVIMNRISLDRFLPRLTRKGLLFYDSSLIPEPLTRGRSVPVPATEIASAVSTTRAANMVMLGAIVAKTGIVGMQSLRKVFETAGGTPSRASSNGNIMTIQEGMRFIENQKSRHSRH